MEILKTGTRLLAIIGASLWTGTTLAAPVTNVTVYPGMTLETVANVTGLGVVKDMAIDPITKNVFIGQATGNGIGNILEVNPAGGTVGTIPFLSQGLAFAPDGTLYFGVASSLLATWRRDTNVFRIFASIPGVRDVQMGADGLLYVATSGPQTVTPVDAVLRVDRTDGYFQSVLTRAQIESTLGVGLTNLFYLAVTSDGTVITSFHNGENVRLTPGCSADLTACLSNFNTRSGRVGELNNAGLAVTPNDLILHYDVSGQLFALWPDGRVKLLAHVDDPTLPNPIKGLGAADTAITTDGNYIYFASDSQQLFRLRVGAGASAPSDLKTHLEVSLGTADVHGSVRHPTTDAPIEGAQVTLNATTVSTGADGSYAFNDVEAGLYEVRVVAAGFPPINDHIALASGDDLTLNPVLTLGLPSFLAPGLKADLVATDTRDNTIGNVDVYLDRNGDLYTMNNADTGRGGNISKIFLHPDTRDYVSSQVVAQGGNLVNAWFVTVDDALNVFSATGNTGLLKLPAQGPGQSLTLAVDAVDSTIVRDQNGVNRFFSRLRDSDGGVILSSGDMVFGSGTSGNSSAAIPCFPSGTRNTLMRRALPIGDSPCADNGSGGTETIYSSGLPTGGGSTLLDNPDIIKIDNQDRIYVSNRAISGTAFANVVRVLADCTAGSSCSAELLWPGNGADKPLDSNGNPVTTGVFSSALADTGGNVFIRGFNFYNEAGVRMRSPDGQTLLPVAAGLLSDYGGMISDRDGKDLYIANKNNVLRIRTIDGRSIADNLLTPPTGAVATILNSQWRPDNRSGKSDLDGSEPDESAKHIRWDLLQPKDQTATTNQSGGGSGGGASIWLWPLFLLALIRVAFSVKSNTKSKTLSR